MSSFHQKQVHSDSRKFLSLCYDKTWTIFDYIEKDTPVFFDDYQKLMNQYEAFERELAQYFTENDLPFCKSSVKYCANSLSKASY